MKGLLQTLAFLIVVALLAVDIYVRVRPPQHASVPAVRPTPAAAPTPTPAVEPATPRPDAPRPRPEGAPTEIVVEESRSDTKTAAAVPAPDAAAGKPAAPTRKPKATGKPPAPTSAAPSAPAGSSGRGFVTGDTFTTGETRVETKDGGADVPLGFEPGGVAVKMAPKVAARIEFDVQPRRLKAGDPYAVKVYLRNEGKKSIKIRELRVASTVNGVRSEAALTPKMKEVPSQLVGLLAEVPGVWNGDAKTWSTEVTVRSGHGDVYKNTVTWR